MQDAAITRPKLLVSVRNVQEARDAIAGGCDILDVKEPANGSLGMADVAVIRRIVVDRTQGFSQIPGFWSATPLSAALGETRDWLPQKSAPVLPRGLQFAKLGTAGLMEIADWQREWQSVRRRFDDAAETPPKWVAVAYADCRRAAAPSPYEVLHAAIAGDCAGFLIDTFVKDGRSLFDAMTPDEIAKLIDAGRKANLFVAVAGSLSLDDLSTAAELGPDIIAVRSAACRDGRRNGPICRNSVSRLRQDLESHSPVLR